MDRSAEETFRHLEEAHGYVDPNAGAGDLLLFDAGRHFHRVTRVEGSRARWTMGCFVGRDAQSGEYVVWS
jgi:hypothetical protein